MRAPTAGHVLPVNWCDTKFEELSGTSSHYLDESLTGAWDWLRVVSTARLDPSFAPLKKQWYLWAMLHLSVANYVRTLLESEELEQCERVNVSLSDTWTTQASAGSTVLPVQNSPLFPYACISQPKRRINSINSQNQINWTVRKMYVRPTVHS